MRDDRTEQPAREAIPNTPWTLGYDQRSGYFGKATVLDSGGTGPLAGSAEQATIEVLPGDGAPPTFEHFLD